MARTRQRHCGRRRDGCAVETVALAPLIQEFVDNWRRDHADLATSPAGEQRLGAGSRRNALGQLAGNEAVSAVTILHERTARVDPSRRGVSETTIRKVLGTRTRWTELRTADALLTASGHVSAFYDGRVPVVPNPRAAPADRVACCGGSLNGSLGFP